MRRKTPPGADDGERPLDQFEPMHERVPQLVPGKRTSLNLSVLGRKRRLRSGDKCLLLGAKADKGHRPPPLPQTIQRRRLTSAFSNGRHKISLIEACYHSCTGARFQIAVKPVGSCCWRPNKGAFLSARPACAYVSSISHGDGVHSLPGRRVRRSLPQLSHKATRSLVDATQLPRDGTEKD